MSVVACICARGGSKGVPGKNIRLLAGRPLIGWAIDTALETPSIDRVIVSTDSEEIAAVARDCGAEVPFIRPVELADDRAPHWAVWQHALEGIAQPDLEIFVDLHTTCPFRSVEDVEGTITLLRKTPEADAAITVCESERNPYFNMVQCDDKRRARLVCEPETGLAHRQAAPKVYSINTAAYALRPAFIQSRERLFDGHVVAYEMPPERSLDIDTELDFEIAGFLATTR